METRKFTPSQKERFLKLASKEIGLIKPSNEELWEEIKKIKRKIGDSDDGDYDENIVDQLIGPDISRFYAFDVPDMGEDVAALFAGSDPVANIEELNENHGDQSKTLLEDGVASIKESASINNTCLHHPRKLVKLLYKFSENGSPLKYATHSWEMGQGNGMYIDLEDFLIKLEKAWKEISWELKELKSELSSKIYAFLLNPKVKEHGWGAHRIKFGWSSPDLVDEIKKQGLNDPSLIQLPDYARQHIKLNSIPTTIQKFDQIIQIFKNEIEIRDEQNYFENLIIELHDQNLSQDFNLKDVRDLKKANFYTDTDYLRKAIIKILGGIKKRTNHSDVSYILEDPKDSEYFVFKIIHHNSNSIDKSIYDSKFSLDRGDFGDIKNYLFNLCDWSIESKFSEGDYRLNFLSSNENTKNHEKLDKESEGFVHLLKFYKS